MRGSRVAAKVAQNDAPPVSAGAEVQSKRPLQRFDDGKRVGAEQIQPERKGAIAPFDGARQPVLAEALSQPRQRPPARSVC